MRRIAAGLLATGLLSGCAGLPVSAQYLDGGKFEISAAVPSEYQTFTASELGAKADPEAFLLGFGGPGVVPSQPFSGDQPGGVLRVSVIPGSLADAEEAAASVFVNDMPALLEEGSVEALTGPAVKESRSLKTIAWTFRMRMSGAKTDSVIRVVSTIGKQNAAAGDGEAHLVKSIAIGCTQECFMKHEKTIKNIEESWRVA